MRERPQLRCIIYCAVTEPADGHDEKTKAKDSKQTCLLQFGGLVTTHAITHG